jgi:hypothetical protein
MFTSPIRALAAAGLLALATSLAACSNDGGDIRAELIDEIAGTDGVTETQKQCLTDLANDTSDEDIEKINAEFEDATSFDPATMSPEGAAFMEGVTNCIIAS